MQNMTIVTMSIKDEVNSRFKEYVYKKYGKEKGVLGKALTEAMTRWLEEEEQEKIAEEAIAIMKKGFAMGKILAKTRGELYERRTGNHTH